MKTTTQTYIVRLYDEFTMMQTTRTMPTKPTTSKGIKAQNNKLEQWVMKELPYYSKIEITPVN